MVAHAHLLTPGEAEMDQPRGSCWSAGSFTWWAISLKRDPDSQNRVGSTRTTPGWPLTSHAHTHTHTLVHMLGPYDTMLPPIADLGFCCSLGTWTRCLLNLINCTTGYSPPPFTFFLCASCHREESPRKSHRIFVPVLHWDSGCIYEGQLHALSM